MNSYNPDKVLTVAENEIGVVTYPSVELIKSTAINGCSLASYYNKPTKTGALIHFYDNQKLSRTKQELIKPDGNIATNLDEWIIAMLDEGKIKMREKKVNVGDLDVNIMAKTLNRERYSKRENEILKKLCKILGLNPIGLDCYDYGGVYLKNGNPFVE